MPHIEGVWETPSITLEPFQIFFLVQLFGFRQHSGARRFSEALFAIARKNAKSTLAAAILLSCLCLENEPGAQVISAATTGKQARIVWKLAREMAARTPDLLEEFDVECFANSVVRAETGSSMVPINSKSSSQDGLNPSVASIDEIHAHKNPDLLNVLRSAAGARANPLWLYTTTEGYETPGPWPELRAYAKQILQRILAADHFLAVIYAIDDEDDEYDPAVWIKANPLMEINPILSREIAQLADNAKAMPSVASEFLIKRCNRQASSALGWVNLHKFKRCAGEIPVEELIGAPCWGALDLSSNMDMSSWVTVWKLDGQYFVKVRYWVPEEQVKLRTERRTVPYGAWVRDGYVTQTPGTTIEQAYIKRAVIEDFGRFGHRKIACDPWNAAQLMADLAQENLPIEQFIQGPKSYHPAMKEFEVAYVNGKLVYDSPVLLWNASNLVARKDVNLNMAPDKSKSTDKIDGIQCVIMGIGLSIAEEDEGDREGFFANPIRSTNTGKPRVT